MKSASLPALVSRDETRGVITTENVGADLPRRRSVIVVLDRDGTELWTHQIDNSPLAEDARLLAELLRMGRLPEAWIPPESIRHQRELVRIDGSCRSCGPA
jgi:hypothetical protein